MGLTLSGSLYTRGVHAAQLITNSWLSFLIQKQPLYVHFLNQHDEIISLQNENQGNVENAENKGIPSKTPPNTPDPRNAANPEDIAPGMSKSSIVLLYMVTFIFYISYKYGQFGNKYCFQEFQKQTLFVLIATDTSQCKKLVTVS